LLPALAVLLVWVAVYGAVFATRQELTQIRYDALATLGYGANWRSVFSHESYWALFSAPSPLRHTWSLAIEEQFYLVWPLIFVGLLARWKRNAPRAVFVTALVLAGVSSVLMVVLYDPASTARAYYGTDTRAAAILFGAALAAWLAMKGPTRNRLALEAIGLVGAGVLALAWMRLDGQSSTLYRGGFLACGLCATAVIATVVHPQPGVLSRVLSLRPLCGLGLISYGVYLYHWPIDVVLDEKRAHLGGWPLFALQTSATLAVAIASYRFIEQPVRRGAFSSYQWRLLTPALSAGLVGALLAGTAGGALPPLDAAGAAFPPLDSAGLSKSVAPPAITRKDAYKTAAPGARRVLLVGNSVAYLMGPSMASIHTDPPLVVLDAALPGCTFVPSTRARTVLNGDRAAIVASRTCHPGWEVGVVQRFRPDVVLWVMSGPPNALWHDGRWLDPCSPSYAATFRVRLRDEVARLGAGGAKVVITTAAYSRYYLYGSDAPINCENPLRREVAAATGAQLVDLFEYICPHGQCREKQDGVALRTDGLHYRGAGGRIVARWLIDQVDAATVPGRD
jgi:peptidoglycan/LPS O-acetylase OafA/YrhL